MIGHERSSRQRRRKRKADGDKWKLNLPCNFLLSRHQRHREESIILYLCVQFGNLTGEILHSYICVLCDCSVIIMCITRTYPKTFNRLLRNSKFAFTKAIIHGVGTVHITTNIVLLSYKNIKESCTGQPILEF